MPCTVRSVESAERAGPKSASLRHALVVDDDVVRLDVAVNHAEGSAAAAARPRATCRTSAVASGQGMGGVDAAARRLLPALDQLHHQQVVLVALR